MHSTRKIWLAFGLAFFLAACGKDNTPSTPLLHLTGSTMGTTYTIKVAQNDQLDRVRLEHEITSLLVRVVDQMSTYRANSELNGFNDAKVTTPLRVSPETAKVVTEALHIGLATQGALDITVAPLVNLWGFGPDQRPSQTPSAEQLAAARAKTGLNQLEVITSIHGSHLKKAIAELTLDLSSIAKGFAVDQVADYLEAHGSSDYMVEIGGEVRLRGVNGQGQPWRIAIEQPSDGTTRAAQVIAPGQMAIATSGDYRNYYELEGKRLSHTIDPRSGRPILHNMASVTVLQPSAMTADGLATAFMVMGPNAALSYADKHHIPVFILLKEGDGFVSKHSKTFAPYLAKDPA
ncbi:MAG: FAD:protein FMN transferase [Aeromonas sp.]